ncbi:MAG: CorA family divalent cation transporter [bacterium]|nr:CorA family divalent cation transporter [bacterium]
MVKKHSYRSLTWIDVESPNAEEVSSLVKEYRLHPILGEELIEKSIKPRFEIYNNCIYIVLHFPIRTQIKDKHFIIEKEVDFIIGKDYIITTKYDAIEPLHNFSKIFEVNSIIDKSDFGDNAGVLFYYMLKRMYKNLSNDLEKIKEELTRIENKIFVGKEKEMVVKISHSAREIIDFHQIVRPHKEIIKNVSDANLVPLFGPNFKYYIEDIHSLLHKIQEMTTDNKELLTDLRETNDSLLSTKQNETMKMLTLMAFITFPLSLIVAIFSLNTTHVPIVGQPYDFEMILGILIAIALTIVLLSKRKDWM